ncbi:MAG: Glutamate transport membrane-spanning protein [uncultured Paraburkholderia sp.]|nr:MAG: Glutamate transport membrane-spanning protein [uncultured Paraburkholderia sp.]
MAPEPAASSFALPQGSLERRRARGAAPGFAAALGVLVAGGLLWALAPDSGTRGETLARFVEWTPALAHGFALNVLISIGAIAIGSMLGLAIGALAQSLPGRIARLWVQAFRNAPWLVLVYFTTYVFPFEFTVFGKTFPFPDWLKVTLALALPASANIAEVLRGAVASIPTLQWEAAASLAFSRAQILLHIVLPQCIRRMLPPFQHPHALDFRHPSLGIQLQAARQLAVGLHDTHALHPVRHAMPERRHRLRKTLQRADVLHGTRSLDESALAVDLLDPSFLT